MHVVATAGHVDHGKSSLVLALTGTDPDRFDEEKRRGLTIDLGFAHTVLPSGAGVSFVDVPGHVRFLKNMLAGVGGVDACVFVVAATEVWKPQSEEHLRILELLGIGHGLIALTKVDLVDDDHRELARLLIADRVAGTFLDGAEIIAVAAPQGIGLDSLRLALDRLLERTPHAGDRGRPRLWVDRSFAAKGAGTVVTGTLAGGHLTVDDHVDIVPSGGRARIRGLQTLGRSVTEIGPGHRVAVNLSGVEVTEVNRGDALVRGAQFRPTMRFDASLTVLESLDHVVNRRGAYVVYIGSGEWPCRVRIIGPASLAPGSSGLVRIHLPRPLPLMPGDRFVLRESGRSETVGGGEVLDVAPVRPASKARPDRDIERVVAEHGWISPDTLEALTGVRREPNAGKLVASPSAIALTIERVTAMVDAAGPEGIDVASLDERSRAVIDRVETVSVQHGRLRAGAVVDAVDDHPYLAALRLGGFTPPDPIDVDRLLLRQMARRGIAVERDGVWFAAETIDEAGAVAAGLLAIDPAGFTVGTFREATGSTRKFCVPLLNELDARGVTRRRGDVRIAGPRLPEPN